MPTSAALPPPPDNAMMRSAAPQTGFTPPSGPAGGAPGPQGAGFPPMAPAPQGPPPPPSPPSPEAMKTARRHVEAIVDGLMELAKTPRGELTRKSVFDAAATMIAKGAFPTADSKQGLIVQLAGLPEDEPALRKAVGGLLLRATAAKDGLDAMPGGR